MIVGSVLFITCCSQLFNFAVLEEFQHLKICNFFRVDDRKQSFASKQSDRLNTRDVKPYYQDV